MLIDDAVENFVQMRHVTPRQRDDTHTAESHMLEQSSDIILIAAQAIHRLCEHGDEFAARRIADQFLMPRRNSDAPEFARSV
ncbi:MULTISPECIES: hypothetical protein [Bradyrhizobium]|uniref:Uncharacterized protein n=1 Tax=Bradyrhizobium septentrionale TaxID=1404411 RepID=A0ABZ2NVL5_9BRAD